MNGRGCPLDFWMPLFHFRLSWKLFSEAFIGNWSFVIFYVLIFSPSFDVHLQHLQEVFARHHTLTSNSTHLNASLQWRSWNLLAISSLVEVDFTKKNIISKYSTPSTAKRVRGFLGMTNYCRILSKDFPTKPHHLMLFLPKTSNSTGLQNVNNPSKP